MAENPNTGVLGPGTRYPWDPAPSVQVPAPQNIDPNASAPPPAAPATPAPATPAVPTAPGTNIPRPDPLAGIGNDQVDKITAAQRQALADANVQVTSIYNELQDTKSKYDAILASGDTTAINQQGAQLSNQLNGLYTRLAGAQQNLSTANTAYAGAVNDALKSVQVDPQQAVALQAQANKAISDGRLADAQAKVLTDGADTQKAKTAADAALASNQALLNKAQAEAVSAKTPQDIATAKAQGDLYGAQANQIQQLLPGLVKQQTAALDQTEAQTRLTDSNSDYYKALSGKAVADTDYTRAQADYQRALIPGAPGLQTAQTAQAAGAGAQAQATAEATLESIKQKQQGPVYGLQQQIDAIKAIRGIQQQIFGPGGTGNPDHADDLLNQYVTATIGGTTPYAANVAAANYAQNQYATGMSGVNALQGAMAQRANQYAQLGGTALSQMASMNQYAPRGSTAGAAAFREVMDEMAQRLGSQQFAPVQMPNAPPLPAFLQAFAAGHQAGAQQAGAQGGGQPTINVNVNGQPAGSSGPTFNPQASTAAMNASGFMDSPAGRAAMAQMMGGAGTGPLGSQPMPYTGGAGPSAMQPMPNVGGQTSPMQPMTGLPGVLGNYFNPPSISTPPATAGPTTPQPAYVPAPVPTIPNLMQNYMAFANPMNMIGMRGA